MDNSDYLGFLIDQTSGSSRNAGDYLRTRVTPEVAISQPDMNYMSGLPESGPGPDAFYSPLNSPNPGFVFMGPQALTGGPSDQYVLRHELGHRNWENLSPSEKQKYLAWASQAGPIYGAMETYPFGAYAPENRPLELYAEDYAKNLPQTVYGQSGVPGTQNYLGILEIIKSLFAGGQ